MTSRNTDSVEGKRGPTVRERVGNAEEALQRAEATLSEQNEKIVNLERLNEELVSELSAFKDKMAVAIQAAVDKVSGELKGKHAVIRARNRKLEGLVAEQVAEKAALASQVEALSFRLQMLEEEVGSS